MGTKTTTATTVHGDVEYETVECDSCGSEVTKESAARFVAGKHYEYEEYNHEYDRRYDFNKDKDFRRGWCCEYCLDNGIVGVPASDKLRPGYDSRLSIRQTYALIVIVSLLVGFGAGWVVI